MVDITMSLDDTLELDTIIKEDDSALNPIGTVKKVSDGSLYNNTFDGFQTKTAVFNPPEPGKFKIPVNDQRITVKVTDPTNILNNQVYHYEFENNYEDSEENYDLNSVTKSFDKTSEYGTYFFSKNTNGYPFAEGDNSFWNPFKSTNELTMTCWVQPFQNDQNYSDPISNEKNNWRFGIGNGAGGSQYINAQNVNISGGSTVPTDSFTFFAVRAKGSTGDLNLRVGNETTISSTSLSSNFDFGGNGIHLIGSGGADGNNDTWDGRIDDLRFFNRYLSDTECNQIKNI